MHLLKYENYKLGRIDTVLSANLEVQHGLVCLMEYIFAIIAQVFIEGWVCILHLLDQLKWIPGLINNWL